MGHKQGGRLFCFLNLKVEAIEWVKECMGAHARACTGTQNMHTQINKYINIQKPLRPIWQMKKKSKIKNALNLNLEALRLQGSFVRFKHAYVCARESKPETALSGRSSPTNRFRITRHFHYSTGHEYQGGRGERKTQTSGQPPQQALFNLSHILLALTDYPTSLGPTLVFDSTRFALLPSHCFPRTPSPALSFYLLRLPGNPNSFTFPSDEDLEDLTSGLTGNISKQLLKMKRGIVKHCVNKKEVLTSQPLHLCFRLWIGKE